jgi:O-acetyl-ADP-ribose deacetylase (regulator of RNase III)
MIKIVYGDITKAKDNIIGHQVNCQAKMNDLSVALPYMIGCYRGGADWKIVEDHLITAFDGYEVTLYKWHRG